jgi:thymidylate synthase ThyX
MKFDDKGHVKNRSYRNEAPVTKFSRGPEAIKVELISWGPQDQLLEMLWAGSQTTWGEQPIEIPKELSEEQEAYANRVLSGMHGGHLAESVTFVFQISGISRACTHQLVRTRIGAGGFQHGGRDNDWRMRGFSIPETVWRMMSDEEGLRSPQIANEALERYMSKWYPTAEQEIDSSVPMGEANKEKMRFMIWKLLDQVKEFYSALVDCGVPWQDARHFLFIGLQTHLMWYYNLPSLRNFLANRLEFIMDWEINCVAQLMRREIFIHCPDAIAEGLMSHSERRGQAAFADLDLSPPDKYYPPTLAQIKKERVGRAEQNPFWVLHPESVRGGPIKWIPTNGEHPLERNEGETGAAGSDGDLHRAKKYKLPRLIQPAWQKEQEV